MDSIIYITIGITSSMISVMKFHDPRRPENLLALSPGLQNP